MTSVYELAKKYYPKLWDYNRIMNLYQKDKLTDQEVQDIIGQKKEE